MSKADELETNFEETVRLLKENKTLMASYGAKADGHTDTINGWAHNIEANYPQMVSAAKGWDAGEVTPPPTDPNAIPDVPGYGGKTMVMKPQPWPASGNIKLYTHDPSAFQRGWNGHFMGDNALVVPVQAPAGLDPAFSLDFTHDATGTRNRTFCLSRVPSSLDPTISPTGTIFFDRATILSLVLATDPSSRQARYKVNPGLWMYLTVTNQSEPENICDGFVTLGN